MLLNILLGKEVGDITLVLLLKNVKLSNINGYKSQVEFKEF